MPGGSPKFNTPDGPPVCPECTEPIRYQERHRADGVWKHQSCAREGTYQHLVLCARELELEEGAGEWMHGLAVLACMRHGNDYQKAAEQSGLSVEFISQAMQPLIDQGVLKDGVWHYDSDVDLDDPQHCTIQVVMWVLCSEGKIVRGPATADPADPSVPDSGGGDANV
jgi:hypothetical protein